MRRLNGLGSLILAFAIWSLALAPSARAQNVPLTIFAAASLKTALDDVAAQWRAAGHPGPRISYAASSALAKQIEQAAPADLFISADLDWMDYLDQRKLIETSSRFNLLGNRIALIAEKGAATRLTISPGFDLAGALGNGRLAMANVDAVPAGKYGKAALEKLGVWGTISAKVAQADNVRAALLLVARGEAPLGIVYRTDAAAEPAVRIVGAFPEDSHPPIIYPAAVVAGAKNGDARRFLDHLRSASAKPLFEQQGFTVLE